jgi:hypothetical protein
MHNVSLTRAIAAPASTRLETKTFMIEAEDFDSQLKAKALIDDVTRKTCKVNATTKNNLVRGILNDIYHCGSQTLRVFPTFLSLTWTCTLPRRIKWKANRCRPKSFGWWCIAADYYMICITFEVCKSRQEQVKADESRWKRWQQMKACECR